MNNANRKAFKTMAINSFDHVSSSIGYDCWDIISNFYQ